MSDPRVKAIDLLYQAAVQYPELRLCQIIVNAVNRNDPFYVTDEQLERALRTHLEYLYRVNTA